MHSNITSNVALELTLDIRPEDFHSNRNATNTVVHWIIDCQYIRQSKALKTQSFFNESIKVHQIEALIESSSIPTIDSELISMWRQLHQFDLPFICQNQSHIIPDPNKTYGYFHTNVTVFGECTFCFLCNSFQSFKKKHFHFYEFVYRSNFGYYCEWYHMV